MCWGFGECGAATVRRARAEGRAVGVAALFRACPHRCPVRVRSVSGGHGTCVFGLESMGPCPADMDRTLMHYISIQRVTLIPDMDLWGVADKGICHLPFGSFHLPFRTPDPGPRTPDAGPRTRRVYRRGAKSAKGGCLATALGPGLSWRVRGDGTGEVGGRVTREARRVGWGDITTSPDRHITTSCGGEVGGCGGRARPKGRR